MVNLQFLIQAYFASLNDLNFIAARRDLIPDALVLDLVPRKDDTLLFVLFVALIFAATLAVKSSGVAG